jgi:hypothetical protein
MKAKIPERQRGKAGSEQKGKPKKKQTETKAVKDRFEFHPGQVLFDGKDLGLPSDKPVEVLKRLTASFGAVVLYKTLDSYYSSATPGTLPKTVSIIRQCFKKHNVPCEVVSKTGKGYVLRESALAKPRQKRVRRKS